MPDVTNEPNDILPKELLSFRVGDQEYSVDIMSVREIRGWSRATPLPHASPYVCGVINLRGTVLLIIDLGKRLGLETYPASERNVIIVVQMLDQTVGLVVDAVSDILSIPLSSLQTPPDMNSDSRVSFVEALTVVEGRMLKVLDLDAVHPKTTLEAA